MIKQVGRIVDTAYLSIWRMRKTKDQSASWERAAGTAIWFTLPILCLVESSVRVTQKWFGVDSLAALVPNRVIYALAVFLPLWFVVYNVYKSVNQKTPVAQRLEKMMSSSSATYRRACVVSYFLFPALLYAVVFFG